MNSIKFVLEAPGASILWGRYYSGGDSFGGGGGGGGGWLGASVREGASNRDITVIPLSIDVVSTVSK